MTVAQPGAGVLVTGANGFIGGQIVAHLLGAGYRVLGAVRQPEPFLRRFPVADAVAVDMNRDTTPESWLPRLDGVDAVINCAGILQQSRGQSIDAIHHRAPAALFDACQTAGVRRVIQISAISADAAAGTDYALSKKAADDHLAGLDLDWVVLRPSLVYGSGSHGGTSLMRALAALPFAVPLVGAGDQPFRPIHLDDLARAVTIILARPDLSHAVIEPVGPERLTLKQILLKLRGWLGLRAVPALPVPVPMVAALCKVGDLTGAGPMRTTSLKQILYGNDAPAEPFVVAVGFTPRTMDAALASHTAQTQDRWHARLFFLRPALRWLLALMWAVSGLLGLFLPAEITYPLANFAGFSEPMLAVLVIGSSLVDLALAAWVASNRRPGLACLVQVAVIVAYTVGLTIGHPGLWLDPFGSLLKNLPILAAVLVNAAIAEER